MVRDQALLPAHAATGPISASKYQFLSDVNLLKIDVDEFEDISLDFQVRAMPTVVFLKNGDEVNRFVGARDESGIKEFIVNSMERWFNYFLSQILFSSWNRLIFDSRLISLFDRNFFRQQNRLLKIYGERVQRVSTL